jgi:hypothetical protein
LEVSPPPQPTLPKTDDIDLNIDMASILAKVNVPIPLTEIMKIPSLRDKVKKFLSIQDESKDPPVLLQTMHYDQSKEEHAPFFITLVVNDLLLHNCILDSGASANVMSLKVMNQSGLKITRPYKNVCEIDSKAIQVCGVIKDLKVHLATCYPLKGSNLWIPLQWYHVPACMSFHSSLTSSRLSPFYSPILIRCQIDEP